MWACLQNFMFLAFFIWLKLTNISFWKKYSDCQLWPNVKCLGYHFVQKYSQGYNSTPSQITWLAVIHLWSLKERKNVIFDIDTAESYFLTIFANQ